MDLVLDVNSELYRMKTGQKFSLALARTLNLDGSIGTNVFDQSDSKTLADEYEYVMHGTVFKVNKVKDSQDM